MSIPGLLLSTEEAMSPIIDGSEYLSKEDMAWRETLAQMVDLALSMHAVLDRIHHRTGHAVNMRIGIAQGPAAGGLSGKIRSRFHIVGPALISAEKMETSGEAGQVHVTADVWDALDQIEYEATEHTVDDGEPTCLIHSRKTQKLALL